MEVEPAVDLVLLKSSMDPDRGVGRAAIGERVELSDFHDRIISSGIARLVKRVGVFGFVLLFGQKHVLQHGTMAFAYKLDSQLSSGILDSIQEWVPACATQFAFT